MRPETVVIGLIIGMEETRAESDQHQHCTRYAQPPGVQPHARHCTSLPPLPRLSRSSATLHLGSDELGSEWPNEFLLAVKDVLWLLDYYMGFE
jgi:hypothetical protein